MDQWRTFSRGSADVYKRQDLAMSLLSGNSLREYQEEMELHLTELYEILHNVAPVKESSFCLLYTSKR